MSRSAWFVFNSTQIEVFADEAPLAWLEHFLRPWFAAEPGGETSRRVELMVDPRRRESLRRVATAPGPPVPCFVLDSGVISNGSLGSIEGRDWIDDDALGVLYGVDASGVEIVAQAEGPDSRVALMRVVRELATVAEQRRGNLVLHCSAVADGPRAIAFCGPKRAGKTSLLLHSLAGSGTSFVANDRGICSVTAEGDVVLRGMPTIAALRADTLDRFPDVARRIRGAPDRHWLTPAENALRTSRPWADTQRAVDLAPAALCRLLGVDARADARLDAIVLPAIDESATGLEVGPASTKAALTGLRGGLVGAALGGAPLSALAGADEPLSVASREAQERTLIALSQLPVYAAQIGRDAFAGEWLGERLLRQTA